MYIEIGLYIVREHKHTPFAAISIARVAVLSVNVEFSHYVYATYVCHMLYVAMSLSPSHVNSTT